MLIIPKFDRCFRNIRDALNSLHMFKQRKVFTSLIWAVTPRPNGISRLIFTALGAFAGFERERISQSISEVKQQQKPKRFWTVGQPPFGYRMNEEGRLEANPEKA